MVGVLPKSSSADNTYQPPLVAAWQGGIVDEDLDTMVREQLIAEARRLRAGIRTHRGGTGHALCWGQPGLWRPPPQKTDPPPTGPTGPGVFPSRPRARPSPG